MQPEESANHGSVAESRLPMSSTQPGSASEPESAPPTGPLLEAELQLLARLLRAGALSVVAVRDEVRITTPGGVDWKLGPAQWFLVQLPLGGRLPDGAIYRAER